MLTSVAAVSSSVEYCAAPAAWRVNCLVKKEKKRKKKEKENYCDLISNWFSISLILLLWLNQPPLIRSSQVSLSLLCSIKSLMILPSLNEESNTVKNKCLSAWYWRTRVKKKKADHFSPEAATDRNIFQSMPSCCYGQRCNCNMLLMVLEEDKTEFYCNPEHSISCSSQMRKLYYVLWWNKSSSISL